MFSNTNGGKNTANYDLIKGYMYTEIKSNKYNAMEENI